MPPPAPRGDPADSAQQHPSARRRVRDGGETAHPWNLTDSRSRLLQIGDHQYTGQSPRTVFPQHDRRHLLPLIGYTARTGRSAEQTTRVSGQTWQANTTPIIGPSGHVHGVLARHAPARQQAPPPPPTAAWECDLDERTLTWTPDMFRIHRVPQVPAAPRSGPIAAWYSKLDPSSYPLVRAALNRVATANDDVLVIQTVQFYDPGQREPTHYRLAVRNIQDHPGAPRRLRGLSTKLPATVTDDPATTYLQGFAHAALALTAIPMCLVDLDDSYRVYGVGNSPPAPWEDLDPRADRRLAALTHPRDLDRLQRFLDAIADTPGNDPVRIRVRMRRPNNGGWFDTNVSAVAVTSAQQTWPRLALLGIEPSAQP